MSVPDCHCNYHSWYCWQERGVCSQLQKNLHLAPTSSAAVCRLPAKGKHNWKSWKWPALQVSAALTCADIINNPLASLPLSCCGVCHSLPVATPFPSGCSFPGVSKMSKAWKEEKPCVSGKGRCWCVAMSTVLPRVPLHDLWALCSVTAGVPMSRKRPQVGDWHGEQHDVFSVYSSSCFQNDLMVLGDPWLKGQCGSGDYMCVLLHK